MLRRLGCRLPIELWHAGPDEMPGAWRAMVEPLDVHCRDAAAERLRHPVRILDGWAMKPFAMLHSAFEEILLLDADNVPVQDPSPLFEAPAYAQAGAVFLARLRLRLAPGPPPHSGGSAGSATATQPEFRKRAVAVESARCLAGAAPTMHMNEHSDFYTTTSTATGNVSPWPGGCSTSPTPCGAPHSPAGPMCQHDFEGRRLFQNRNLASGRSRGTGGFPGSSSKDECLRSSQELQHGAAAGDTARRQSPQ